MIGGLFVEEEGYEVEDSLFSVFCGSITRTLNDIYSMSMLISGLSMPQSFNQCIMYITSFRSSV